MCGTISATSLLPLLRVPKTGPLLLKAAAEVVVAKLGPGCTLRSLAHPPGLPQVASLVRRNDVQACGQAEPHAADEGIGEAHPNEINVRVFLQECTHLVLRCEELSDRIVERGRGARPNTLRCLRSEEGLYGRFERTDKPTADQSWLCGSTSSPPFPNRPLTGRLHRAQVHTVGGSQMIKAFGNAPRVGFGAPSAQFLAQAGHERPGIALCRVEGCFQRLDVWSIARLHDSVR